MNSNPKTTRFISLLHKHGEVLVKMASGETWALHLGDKLQINDDFIEFEDNQRNVQVLFFDQVEKIYTHVAHLE